MSTNKAIREKLFAFTEDFSSNLPMYLQELIMQKFSRLNPNFSQFLLDCSIDCDVIVLAQKYGDDILRHIFLITRTWIYSLHRHRLRLLGLWHQASYWPVFEQRRPFRSSRNSWNWQVVVGDISCRSPWNQYLFYEFMFSHFTLTVSLRKSCFGCWLTV